MAAAGRARPARGWAAEDVAEPSMIATFMGPVSKGCAAGADAPWSGGNSCHAWSGPSASSSSSDHGLEVSGGTPSAVA
eukprot:6951399-Heterocapsa_arctica.AAC.1